VGEEATAPDGTASRVLVRDTWNTDILPALAPEPSDVVLYKHRYSGFYETDLDAVLRSRGVTDLIVTGCTTSVCVESTVRDAMFRDYRCLLLADCSAEPCGDGLPRSNHEASLLVIQSLFGWVSSSADLVAALERQLVATAP
jgi:ureidoacrylate peracid hydrolase